MRLVGHRKQPAVGLDQQAREAAEGTVLAGESERALEGEGAEPVKLRLLLRERQGAGAQRERGGRPGEKAERAGERGAARERLRPQATRAACSAAARCQASAASSSNSSASFFITVPPSSSASTIVTARR